MWKTPGIKVLLMFTNNIALKMITSPYYFRLFTTRRGYHQFGCCFLHQKTILLQDQASGEICCPSYMYIYTVQLPVFGQWQLGLNCLPKYKPFTADTDTAVQVSLQDNGSVKPLTSFTQKAHFVNNSFLCEDSSVIANFL